jgi:hypothetical protein
MSSSVHIAAISVLTLVLAPVLELRGQLVTFRFDGRVTDVQVDIPDYWDTPNIDWPDVGTTFTGFYTCDPTPPDTAGSSEQRSKDSNSVPEPATCVLLLIGWVSFAATFAPRASEPR